MSMIHRLHDKYARWCKAQGFECVDAMELLCEHKLTSKQSKWITNFMARWEVAEEAHLKECWHREGRD